MSLPISYKPELWQQRRLPTLLKLLHDAAYDPAVNARIAKGDDEELARLVRSYLPDANPALVNALLDSTRAAKKWVDTHRTTSGREEDAAMRESYTKNMRTVLDFLMEEMHSEDFSIAW